MRNFRWVAALVLAALLIAPSISMATPVEFVFTTTICGPADTPFCTSVPTIPGVSLGDTLTLTVTADNGGSTLVSQTWSETDIQSATLAVGTDVATYVAPHFSTSGFETDALGEIIDAYFADSDTNNTGIGGPSPNAKMFTNGIADGANNFA